LLEGQVLFLQAIPRKHTIDYIIFAHIEEHWREDYLSRKGKNFFVFCETIEENAMVILWLGEMPRVLCKEQID